MIEVVIDTNVLVAAFRSALGASYRLLQTLEQGAWRPVISPTLAFEYEAVLKRQESGLSITAQDVDGFIDYFCGRAAGADLFPLAADFVGPGRRSYPGSSRSFAVERGYLQPIGLPRGCGLWSADRDAPTAIDRDWRTLMTLTINLADDLYKRAAEIAAEENVPVEQLFASAFEDRLREFECLKERAARGSRDKFLKVLEKVPAIEPPDYDRL